MNNTKFQVGNIVEVKDSGTGCGPDDVGKTVTITEIGMYSSEIGYKVHPPLGNTLTGDYSGFIGESSFEFISGKVNWKNLLTERGG